MGFQAQLAQIREIYPDFKTMPLSVLQAVQSGKSAVTEYVKYRNAKAAETAQKAAKAETANVRRENAVLKQNAKAAQRAPVRGVTGGGGSAKDQQEDPFLAGFERDYQGW